MDDFVEKLTPVIIKIKNDLNKEEQKKLKEACQIVGDLIEKIKKQKNKIKQQKDKIKQQEDEIKQHEIKIKFLNLRIDNNNKEFESKEKTIKKLQTEISDLQKQHQENVEIIDRSHARYVTHERTRTCLEKDASIDRFAFARSQRSE